MDQAFLKKKMKKVIASYLQDPQITLSDEELNQLLAEFHRRIGQEQEESIHFILHDVIYDYLTNHYFK